MVLVVFLALAFLLPAWFGKSALTVALVIVDAIAVILVAWWKGEPPGSGGRKRDTGYWDGGL